MGTSEGQDCKFQTRLKFSSKVEKFQARLNVFNLWALGIGSAITGTTSSEEVLVKQRA